MSYLNPNTIEKKTNNVPWPDYQPEFPDDAESGGDDDAPTSLPSGQTPNP